jgi:hypothetical protein
MFRITSQIQILLRFLLLIVFSWIIEKFPNLYAYMITQYRFFALFWYRWIFSIIIALFVICSYFTFTFFYQFSRWDSEVISIQKNTITFIQLITIFTFIALLSIYYIDNVQKIMYIIYRFFLLSGIVIRTSNFLIEKRTHQIIQKNRWNNNPEQQEFSVGRLISWLFWGNIDERYKENNSENVDDWVEKAKEELSFFDKLAWEKDESVEWWDNRYIDFNDKNIPEDSIHDNKDIDENFMERVKMNYLFSSKITINDPLIIESFKS